MQVIRAIHKYKDEFTVLFSDLNLAKKRLSDMGKKDGYKQPFINNSISLSDDAKKEYLLLVEKYLKVKKYPNNNRKVVITTHNGGKHVGFYEDGKWWYSTLYNPKVAEKGIVIKWEKNYF
jgi:hypothetical protein